MVAVSGSSGSRGAAGAVSLLLIEDDPGDALLVEEMAADSAVAFEIVWVRSLDEARLALKRGPLPDCIVLDLHLPDVQGLDALTSLQVHSAELPVIVMTGLAEEQAGLSLLARGAQDYLVKGHVDTNLLTRAVRYAIERKRAERETAALRASEQRSRENVRLERGLLPVPLLRDGKDVEVITRYRAGRVHGLLGGDFFDVVQCEDGTVHVLIGDVCGHGPDEAALGVGLRIAWRTLVLGGVTAAVAMATLEEILVAERPRPHIFATVTSVRLPPDRRTLQVVRAGHPGLMLRGPSGVRWLEVPGGPALGIRRRRRGWPQANVPIDAQDAIVLFTDGLFEVRTGTDDFLGEDGLLAHARACHPGRSGEQFVDALIDHVESLAAQATGLPDDVAVVHVRWSDEAGHG